MIFDIVSDLVNSVKHFLSWGNMGCDTCNITPKPEETPKEPPDIPRTQ